MTRTKCFAESARYSNFAGKDAFTCVVGSKARCCGKDYEGCTQDRFGKYQCSKIRCAGINPPYRARVSHA